MQTVKQRAIREGNPCAKTRKREDPYEVWKSRDASWTWNVLKKWQANDEKPFARWFCFVTSPYCPEGEYGDVYVKDIKEQATKVSDFIKDDTCVLCDANERHEH
jgi:hypothetical protein